jgi:hypothetical protein
MVAGESCRRKAGTDVLTPEERNDIMSRVEGKNTRPEV